MAFKSSNLRKSENQTPNFSSKVTQFSNLSKRKLLFVQFDFKTFDWGCFNLELNILQSKTGCELSELLIGHALIWNLTYCNLKLVVNYLSYKVSKHGTCLIRQGTKRR